MTPNPAAQRTARIVVPIVVIAIGLGLVAIMAMSKRQQPIAPPAETPAEAPAGPDPALVSESVAADGGAPVDVAEDDPALAGAREEFDTLVAMAPESSVSGHDVPPAALGSLDPTTDTMRVEFDRAGAGVARIAYADIWETVEAKLAAADTSSPPPDEALRYALDSTRLFRTPQVPAGLEVPVLATIRVEINGMPVDLFDFTASDAGPVYTWGETGPGRFETVVRDGEGRGVVRISRAFTLRPPYGMNLEQRVENLTDAPLDIVWSQYGPGDLRLDRSRYMDRRRFRFGWLDPVRNPARNLVLSDDNSLLFERTDVVKLEGDELLWPNEYALDRSYELSWIGSTNRYFGLALHPPLDDADAPRTLGLRAVDHVLQAKSEAQPDAPEEEQESIFTYLIGPSRAVAPGATIDFDLGVFAGPLDRHILESEPYVGLGMQRLILYQMSSCCAICTFQWLAHLLLGFLTLLHDFVLFDYGLAIIALVMVVRAILHPIAKRGQVSMQRFGRQMSSLKPELDKIQTKYAGDKQKLQTEQMRLMREHGINPLRALGCVPMLLQTPIWIALYAMLYFAFDIRQEAAFFGIFQTVSGGAWPFLADLSSADHCFGKFSEPFRFLMWNVTGINILPVLMGVMFFIQQKYLSPPPSAAMTQEQMRQQKMMRVLMPIMFPLMLYSAPSGLTLYIMTSSIVGIIEGRYIRKHIDELDPPTGGKSDKDDGRRGAKPKDPQGRAYAAAVARMEEKRRMKAQGPPKKFKKRK